MSKDRRKLRDELAEGNERSYRELQQASDGRFQMDTSDMRRELLIECLKEWGLVTEDQLIEFDIRFHQKVEDALNGAHQQLRNQKNQRNLQVVKKDGRLVDQHGRPLK